VTSERIDATDGSGDFVIVIRDGDKVLEVQEYDSAGDLKRRSYSEDFPGLE
jgi:hypothetical protein